MKDLREHLEANLVGQDHVIADLIRPVQSWKAGFHWGTKPAGVFLLMGPSGTGKTLSAELIAEHLHGYRNWLIKVDCAEFQHSHEIAKLIGSPPGYLGHRETNPLLSAARLRTIRTDAMPLSIVLFDEIEKANEALNQLLLGILDKGVMTTGANEEVKFTNTLIFLTSNLGTRQLARPSYTFAKSQKTNDLERRRAVTKDAARKHFSPEFLNRVDVQLTYNHLESGHIKRIVRHYEADTNKNLREKIDGAGRLQITVSDAAAEWLMEESDSKEYGARELKRVWDRNVLGPLAEFVSACAGGTRKWPVLRVDVTGGRLDFVPLTLEESLAASLPPLVEVVETMDGAIFPVPGKVKGVMR